MPWNTIDNSQTFEDDFNSYTAELKEGQFLGENKNYRLVKNLGVGGMGEAWLASQILDGAEIRQVVVKTLRPDRRGNEGAQEKALKQFQLIQSLNHQNICPIYDIEKDPACGYLIVMGYANGGSYADWFAQQKKQNGALPLKKVCDVLRPIADALDHAHRFGVIHHDVKPENMMFVKFNGIQTSWLIDFGIAANLRTATQATTGQYSSSGTDKYMAAEQKNSQLQTAQTDEYSLAMVALEFLTGSLSPVSLFMLSAALQPILAKALAPEPSNRYSTCREFIDALSRTTFPESSDPKMVSVPTPVSPKPTSVAVSLQAPPKTGTTEVMLPTSSVPKTVVTPTPTSPKPTPVVNPLPAVSGNAGERMVLRADGIEYAFRWCPPNEFMMGGDKYDNEKPVHKVKLTKGFWMLETEVTQAMWQSVMGDNPSKFKGEQKPVECVSWNDCQSFCKKLSQKLGQQVQLPTEAQWEYACRAGTTGDDAGDLDSMAWHKANSGSTTHAVGQKKPNNWGLYDMHGNVCEWCSDFYDANYYNRSPTNDPENTNASSYRVFRGGRWISRSMYCWSAYRRGIGPDYRNCDVGLRVLLIPSPEYVNIKPKQKQSLNSPVRKEQAKTESLLISGNTAGKRKVLTYGGIDYAFRWCPPGEFMMGGNKNNSTKAIHKVILTKGFWLLETQVTQVMWEKVMGENPSRFKGEKNPVDCVSWNDSQEFCKRLSQKLGQQVQLPTEAQWEYACRAGTLGDYAGNLDEMAWYTNNSGSTTHAVGQKKPNLWGFYDMLGNVWEWCSDFYDKDYYGKSPMNDPENITASSGRVIRGGSWNSSAESCRSVHRNRQKPRRKANLGLRILLIPNQKETESIQSLPNLSINKHDLSSSNLNAGNRKVLTVSGIEYAFRWCPPGEFMMGSTNGDSDEKPVHKVKLTRGFWLLETQITQGMWQSVMGKNPSWHVKGWLISENNFNRPVEQVSWDDCQKFCNKLSQKLGQRVQLPTEAQWEYACRAGTTGDYAGNLDQMAWYNESLSSGSIHPVAQKQQNAWGLYDMHGNVWEWCSDYYAGDYYSRSPASDPENTAASSGRVVRGGSWDFIAGCCRSAHRDWSKPGLRYDYLGLRVTLVPSSEE